MRQTPAGFANAPLVQSALRTLRAHLSRPTTFAVLCAIALILTLIDAFALSDHASLGQRLAYLLAMVWITYAIGFFVGGTFGAWIRTRGLHGPIAWALQGAVAGLFILVAVVALNLLFFGQPTVQSLMTLAPMIIGGTIIITAALEFVGGEPRAGTEAPQPPRLLTRLPLQRRGTLLALSAEDHYTRVTTDKGDELILMRLTDAIEEASPIEGLRVHRSHWVATGAIVGVERLKGRAVLTLTDGTEVPVSRSYLPIIRGLVTAQPLRPGLD
ncbi:MAG: LytTR family DNA-binding domain-containing protein [Pseudomonadota bacterium]